MDYKDHLTTKFNANEDSIKRLKFRLVGISDPIDIEILDELIAEGLNKRKVIIDKLNCFKNKWWE